MSEPILKSYWLKVVSNDFFDEVHTLLFGEARIPGENSRPLVGNLTNLS